MSKSHEEILVEYSKRHISQEKNLYAEANGIHSDYKFFRELIRRSQKASPSLFSFDLRIANPGLIWDFFWRCIEYMGEILNRPEYIKDCLAIFYITQTLIHKCSNGASDDIFQELLNFEPTIKFYTGLTINQCLVAFEGCSHSLEAIENKLNKMNGAEVQESPSLKISEED